MSAFDDAFDRLIGVEGNYADDPSDAGGATRWGVTERVARAHGYTGDMKDYPREDAKAVYRAGYWNPLMLDQVAALSVQIAYELFDTDVNLPFGMAAKFLQRSLNVLNDGGSWYADIPVDGRIGKLTLAALQDFLKARPNRGEAVLLRALNSLQGAWYIELAEAKPADEKFVYGWFVNRVS